MGSGSSFWPFRPVDRAHRITAIVDMATIAGTGLAAVRDFGLVQRQEHSVRLHSAAGATVLVGRAQAAVVDGAGAQPPRLATPPQVAVDRMILLEGLENSAASGTCAKKKTPASVP